KRVRLEAFPLVREILALDSCGVTLWPLLMPTARPAFKNSPSEPAFYLPNMNDKLSAYRSSWIRTSWMMYMTSGGFGIGGGGRWCRLGVDDCRKVQSGNLAKMKNIATSWRRTAKK